MDRGHHPCFGVQVFCVPRAPAGEEAEVRPKVVARAAGEFLLRAARAVRCCEQNFPLSSSTWVFGNCKLHQLKGCKYHYSTYIGPKLGIRNPLQGPSIYLQLHGPFGQERDGVTMKCISNGPVAQLLGFSCCCKSRIPASCFAGTQYLRTLVPKTIPLMLFGPRVLKYWVLGPSGVLFVLKVSPETLSHEACGARRCLGQERLHINERSLLLMNYMLVLF